MRKISTMFIKSVAMSHKYFKQVMLEVKNIACTGGRSICAACKSERNLDVAVVSTN